MKNTTLTHISYILVILGLIYLGIRHDQKLRGICQEQKQQMIDQVVKAQSTVNEIFVDIDMLRDTLDHQRDLNVHLIYELEQKRDKPFKFKGVKADTADVKTILNYFEEKFELQMIQR